jgi:hypothetical protein
MLSNFYSHGNVRKNNLFHFHVTIICLRWLGSIQFFENQVSCSSTVLIFVFYCFLKQIWKFLYILMYFLPNSVNFGVIYSVAMATHAYRIHCRMAYFFV